MEGLKNIPMPSSDNSSATQVKECSLLVQDISILHFLLIRSTLIILLFSFYLNSQHAVTLTLYYSYPLSYHQTSVQCSKSLSLVSEHLESQIAPPIQELSRRIRYRVDVLRDTYAAQLELLEGSPGSLPYHTHLPFTAVQCTALHCTVVPLIEHISHDTHGIYRSLSSY